MVEVRVERFLRSSGMAPTRFGRLVARDPRLVFDMRRGRILSPRVATRVMAFLESAEARQESASCSR